MILGTLPFYSLCIANKNVADVWALLEEPSKVIDQFGSDGEDWHHFQPIAFIRYG